MMTNKQLDEIFKIETQVLIKIDFLKFIKFSNLLVEKHIQQYIGKRYNKVRFENVGSYLQAHTMTIVVNDASIVDSIKEDVIACIVEYAKPFYELKHEYESKSKQDQHHSKIMMIAKIGAMGITNFDFDGALNELAYLYSQYKDVV